MQREAKSKTHYMGELSYGEVIIKATSINKAIIDYLHIKQVSVRGAISYGITTEYFIHIVLHLRLCYYRQPLTSKFISVLSIKDFIKQCTNVKD